MVKYGVLFEVRTGFLNVTQTRFGFEGLKVDNIVEDIKWYQKKWLDHLKRI
jgi:hypothetical protein